MFSIIAFATKMALPGEVNRQVSFDLGKVLRSYLYPYDNPFRELWFSVALFWMFLLMPIWQFVLKRRWAMWGMVTILFVLHFFHPETQLLAIDKTCLHGIWFFTGLVLSKEEVVEKVFERQPCVIMLAGSVVYAVGIIVSFSLLKTIGGITFSFGIALIADRYLPKLFFTFRNYTYQIFLMGIFAQMLVKILSHHFSLHYVEAYILCVLFGLYVPVLASKIIEKINWKPLKLCCGLK